MALDIVGPADHRNLDSAIGHDPIDPRTSDNWSAGTHQTRSYSERYRHAYSVAIAVFPTPPSPCTACGNGS
jgi:hypothetical protein